MALQKSAYTVLAKNVFMGCLSSPHIPFLRKFCFAACRVTIPASIPYFFLFPLLPSHSLVIGSSTLSPVHNHYTVHTH